jgi:hypothetical protein
MQLSHQMEGELLYVKTNGGGLIVLVYGFFIFLLSTFLVFFIILLERGFYIIFSINIFKSEHIIFEIR